MFEIKYKVKDGMDEKGMKEALDIFEKAYPKYLPLDKEYLAFSKFIQSCFITEDGYIMDTGSYRDANLILMRLIEKRIKKHPLLWKIFFMVA